MARAISVDREVADLATRETPDEGIEDCDTMGEQPRRNCQHKLIAYRGYVGVAQISPNPISSVAE